MPALNAVVKERLEKAVSQGLKRQLNTVSHQWLDPVLEHNGKSYLQFSSNDYLGLRTHTDVLRAAAAAIDIHGAGAGASRLVTGNHPAFAELEAALAAHKGTEAALVFGSGYLANIGTISALMGEGDLIIADKLVHACMIDGAHLSGAKLVRFAHNDMAHLESCLKQHRANYTNCLILTESVFSMDGDRAPLEAISALAHAHDSWLMVDDAHGIGFMETKGADIISGTLSKSLGSYGGYVAASNAVIDYLISHARSFIFSTGLPASAVTAAHEALIILKSEPERAMHVMELAEKLTGDLNLPKAQSPIIPVIIGDNQKALEIAERLRAEGIWIQAIRPPTVPPGTARLRITLTANHTAEQVRRLVNALQACGVK